MWRLKISQSGYEAFALQVGETAAGFYELLLKGPLANAPLPVSTFYASVHFWNGEKHEVHFVKPRHDNIFLRLFDWLNDESIQSLGGSALLVWQTPPDDQGVRTRHVLTGVCPDTSRMRFAALNGATSLMQNAFGTHFKHIEWEM